MRKIRVLIVDDSPLVRSVLSRILSEQEDIQVIGEASDPFEAKRWIIEEDPDVVTLDVEMPRMDGITFLKRIMAYKPVPVLMISSYTQENSMRTLEALEAGAVDFVPKPVTNLETNLSELKREIVAKVRAAGWAKVKPPVLLRKKPDKSFAQAQAMRIFKIIGIGASTGGTLAVEKLLSSMNYHTSGIVVVQHMPPKYTANFAQRLDSLVPQTVVEATDRQRLEKDLVLIAPGGKHMRLVKDDKGYSVRLFDGPPVNHQRPSVDVLFESMAKVAGREAVGVVLTGMGDDGARGLLSMRQAGALTLAQDEASCVVFGMPRAAIENNGAAKVAPIPGIASTIFNSFKAR